MMKVLIAASEAHPFIKTGGLGDVIGALPEALKKLGIDVRVVIPNYRDIKREIKDQLQVIKEFKFKINFKNECCGILQYKYNDVTYYLLDNEYYFKRSQLYGYHDDGEKFAFFNKAVLEFLREIDWKPDIIHCNDWQTGMIPVLHKVDYINKSFYKDIKTVICIHNLFFQGVVSTNILSNLFGYNYELLNDESLKLYDGVSFLKGAINFSDKVITVSKTYAEEIQTPEYGEALDKILSSKGKELNGIVNGIDYNEYNPETDKYIFKNYSINTFEYKKDNKEELQKELGLNIDRDIPMIGMVSRLTHQKGCDLIINMLDGILHENIQVVILGTGDSIYESKFKEFQERYPDKVSSNIMFNDELAHKIYAGSDMFLMPSLFEPCGLAQLIALRYGTIPIVRETGGLKDTVISYDRNTGIGTGFKFKKYDYNLLKETIEYALEVYKNKEIWQGLILQSMNSDNSWGKSAKEYKKLYEELID